MHTRATLRHSSGSHCYRLFTVVGNSNLNTANAEFFSVKILDAQIAGKVIPLESQQSEEGACGPAQASGRASRSSR